MTAYRIVALSSAIGGATRHGVNVWAARLIGTGWPYGTFAVNILGSFGWA
jgi:fluoride exporter